MAPQRKRKNKTPLGPGAQLKQARESVAMGKLVTELENQGLVTGDGFVWGDPDGTALVELVPERSHVVLKKIWATECRRGHASRLLSRVCAAADAAEMKLRLETRPFRLSLWSTWKKQGDPPEEKTKQSVTDWLCRFRYLPTPAGKRRGALGKKELRAWYERFGFVQAGRTTIMVRPPRPKPAGGDNLE